MYTLALTSNERKAFDWVGHRYVTGYEVSCLLMDCLTDYDEWSNTEDIIFQIPEHIAWQIRDLSFLEGDFWPCLGGYLKRKMNSFIDSIV